MACTSVGRQIAAVDAAAKLDRLGLLNDSASRPACHSGSLFDKDGSSTPTKKAGIGGSFAALRDLDES